MELFDCLKNYPVSIKIISSLYSPLEPRNLKIRSLSIEDLIGREEVFPIQNLLEKEVNDPGYCHYWCWKYWIYWFGNILKSL